MGIAEEMHQGAPLEKLWEWKGGQGSVKRKLIWLCYIVKRQDNVLIKSNIFYYKYALIKKERSRITRRMAIAFNSLSFSFPHFLCEEER